MAEAPLTDKPSQRSNATVFLGGGRITSALLAGLRLAGYRRPIMVHDRHVKKLRVLKRKFHVEVAPDLAHAIRRAEMLIVAVRPDSVAMLLDDMAPALSGMSHRPLIVSLAAGVPLQQLRRQLGVPARWARAMPSPVSRIRQGLIAVTFDRSATSFDRQRVRRFFENVGSALEVSESKLDIFTAAYSSSHGYHALATLAKAAQAAGLDRKTALTAASHALADGILCWRESGQSLEDLLHEAATPGGIAAATIEAMNSAGYEETVLHGLRAGIERARRNADLPTKGR
jgi:pyrroline-5-carboxylate reductase